MTELWYLYIVMQQLFLRNPAPSQKFAPLSSFMTIYFKYLTVINDRLIYAELGRWSAASTAHLKNM